MASAFHLIQRLYQSQNPPQGAKNNPIRFGILGAAAIAPAAIITPARNHPEAVVLAVAARSKDRAAAYAKKHDIPKVYGGPTGYRELINDPEIDAIYNPLPNGLHYEWTLKALAAGKHVLLEKPSANTADETREMFEFAEKRGLVLLEAFHYRFHPAVQRVKVILESGELGAVRNLSATLTVPSGFVPQGDIRLDYQLGGGALMDMGCYTINCVRYLAGLEPTEVLSASYALPIPSPGSAGKVGRCTTATLAFPNDVTATITCDMGIPHRFGFIPRFPQVAVLLQCEKDDIELYNFVAPTLYHSIIVKKKGEKGNVQKREEKVYKFADSGIEGRGDADWWTTYRQQLEAFVDRLKGREPHTWLDKEDSIANMEWIEMVYAKGVVPGQHTGNRNESDDIMEYYVFVGISEFIKIKKL
ncbi:hypothetical protein AX16_001715 [Volvariella volvacea WC 439]|nr:hypothetical protein AX16_001715 [Volvariella volvacea WC 439]